MVGTGGELSANSNGVSLEGSLVGAKVGIEYGGASADLLKVSVGNFKLGYNKSDPLNPFTEKKSGAFSLGDEVAAGKNPQMNISKKGEVGLAVKFGAFNGEIKANLVKAIEYVKNSAEATKEFFKSYLNIGTKPGVYQTPSSVYLVRYKKSKDYQQNGIKTEGTITDIILDYKGQGRYYYPIVSFTLKDGTWVKAKYSDGSYPASFKVGHR
eukprot:gene17079-20484_t